MISKFLARILRVQKPGPPPAESDLMRCLGTSDVAILGLSGMIGSGVFVLTGEIAKNVTGPAVGLSFLLSGILCGLSAWSYAELSATIPRTGSAYSYAYVTMGELAAFLVGWSVILEVLCGSAALSRAFMGYFNSISGNFTAEITPQVFLDHQLDPYTVVLITIVAAIICSGVKNSVRFSNVLTILKLAIVALVTVCAFTRAEASNWSPFLPNGVGSLFEGAAHAFFGFGGFDGITTLSEECRNPKFTVPFAIFFDIIATTIIYTTVSTALTLMVPYMEIHEKAAFSGAFNDWIWVKIVISVGALVAMFSGMIAAFTELSRFLYAMSKDGLLFDFLAKVNKHTHVPVRSVITLASVTSCFAFFLPFTLLVKMLSMGTLICYCCVSFSLIVSRYRPSVTSNLPASHNILFQSLKRNLEPQPFRLRRNKTLGWKYEQICAISLFIFLTLFTNLYISNVLHIGEIQSVAWAVTTLCLLLIFLSLCYLRVVSYDYKPNIPFQVPMVPFLPGFSVFANVYMMCQFDWKTWLAMSVWISMGLVVYFLFSINNSSLEQSNSEDKEALLGNDKTDAPRSSLWDNDYLGNFLEKNAKS